jgi:phage terminase small subunit
MSGELTPKQARFVDEYLKDLNATQAAIRSGYSERTAQEQSSRLLSNVIVQRAIQERRAILSEKAGRTALDVLADIGRVRAHCMELVPTETGDEVMRSPKEALKALELEGKHHGAFVDKVQLSNPDGSLRPRVIRIVAAKAKE